MKTSEVLNIFLPLIILVMLSLDHILINFDWKFLIFLKS